MTTEYPGRRRAPLCAAAPIAGFAAALCLLPGTALAVETTRPRASSCRTAPAARSI